MIFYCDELDELILLVGTEVVFDRREHADSMSFKIMQAEWSDFSGYDLTKYSWEIIGFI